MKQLADFDFLGLLQMKSLEVRSELLGTDGTESPMRPRSNQGLLLEPCFSQDLLALCVNGGHKNSLMSHFHVQRKLQMVLAEVSSAILGNPLGSSESEVPPLLMHGNARLQWTLLCFGQESGDREASSSKLQHQHSVSRKPISAHYHMHAAEGKF